MGNRKSKFLPGRPELDFYGAFCPFLDHFSKERAGIYHQKIMNGLKIE
jgi:hypothetical protein